eukprot:snap_masked-scaffold_1-processed-gene-14.21-mRNA-1 protein AED:1.00 eAED:1.00 QI:0/-1/0/0/-1/1/1/0/300
MDQQKILIKRKIQELKFENIGKYLNCMKELVSELRSNGGEPDRQRVEEFIQKLPDKGFNAAKLMCSARDMDSAIDYFVEMKAKLELRSNNNNNTTSLEQPFEELKIGKTRIKRKVIRCLKCGGYGHIKLKCPSPNEHCYKCGSSSHKYKNCNLKLIRIAKLEVVDFEFAEEEDNNIPEECPKEEGEVSINICKFSVSINQLSTLGTYCCRYGQNCINAVVDGGATHCITPNLSLLTSTKKITNVKVSCVLSKESMYTVIGTLKLMLLNNIEIEIENMIYIPSAEDTIFLNPNFLNPELTF